MAKDKIRDNSEVGLRPKMGQIRDGFCQKQNPSSRAERSDPDFCFYEKRSDEAIKFLAIFREYALIERIKTRENRQLISPIEVETRQGVFLLVLFINLFELRKRIRRENCLNRKFRLESRFFVAMLPKLRLQDEIFRLGSSQ